MRAPFPEEFSGILSRVRRPRGGPKEDVSAAHGREKNTLVFLKANLSHVVSEISGESAAPPTSHLRAMARIFFVSMILFRKVVGHQLEWRSFHSFQKYNISVRVISRKTFYMHDLFINNVKVTVTLVPKGIFERTNAQPFLQLYKQYFSLKVMGVYDTTVSSMQFFQKL